MNKIRGVLLQHPSFCLYLYINTHAMKFLNQVNTKHVGETLNYVLFNNDDNSIDFYSDNIHVAKIDTEGNLHLKGETFPFSPIFNP